MNPLFSTALGGCFLLAAAAAFSAETLVHASNWETLSYEEFGDRATNYDCEFAVDYLRGGQAYLPPPSGTIILLY